MAIAEELAGARFSLITFDTNAVVRMPLTTDTSALDTLVTVLEPQVTAYSKGSSVTVAAKVLDERLRAARETPPGAAPARVLPRRRGTDQRKSAGTDAAGRRAWSPGERCWATGQPRADG